MPELKQLGTASRNRLIKSYQRSAKRRGLSFGLDEESFYSLAQSVCYYCGDPPSNIFKNNSKRKGFYVHSGIDRKNNKIGYTKNNSVACCKVCNFSKHKLSEKLFLDMVERVYLNKIKK